LLLDNWRVLHCRPSVDGIAGPRRIERILCDPCT
jgi:hypothetical protein